MQVSSPSQCKASVLLHSCHPATNHSEQNADAVQNCSGARQHHCGGCRCGRDGIQGLVLPNLKFQGQKEEKVSLMLVLECLAWVREAASKLTVDVALRHLKQTPEMVCSSEEAARQAVTLLRKANAWWGREQPPRLAIIINPVSGSGGYDCPCHSCNCPLRHRAVTCCDENGKIQQY